MMTVEIRRHLDASQLDVLSEEERDAADEVGELDGNHHYVDLSASAWDDVAYALVSESQLIQRLEAADDPAAEENAIYEARDLEEEREALWHLDIGVASAVMALNALGAHTVLSCNGGEFGGQHVRDCPCIRFFPNGADVTRLLALASQSDIGLVEEDRLALLYGHKVRDLQRFAALALEQFGISD